MTKQIIKKIVRESKELHSHVSQRNEFIRKVSAAKKLRKNGKLSKSKHSKLKHKGKSFKEFHKGNDKKLHSGVKKVHSHMNNLVKTFNHRQINIAIVLLIAFLLIRFLGGGITGFAVLNEVNTTIEEYYSQDSNLSIDIRNIDGFYINGFIEEGFNGKVILKDKKGEYTLIDYTYPDLLIEENGSLIDFELGYGKLGEGVRNVYLESNYESDTLCSVWEINEIEFCDGYSKCCSFLEKERNYGEWNYSIVLNKGRYLAEDRNIVSVKVYDIDYSFNPSNSFLKFEYSDKKKIVVDLFEKKEFSSCGEACFLKNSKDYLVEIFVDSGRIYLDNFSFSTKYSQNTIPSFRSIPNITMSVNTSFKIDLSNYVYDDEKLVFDYFKSDEISVKFNNTVAEIYANEVGKTFTYFSAFDKKEIGISNIFMIEVIDKVEESIDVIKPVVRINQPVKWVKKIPVTDKKVKLEHKPINITIKADGKEILDSDVDIFTEGKSKQLDVYENEKKIEILNEQIEKASLQGDNIILLQEEKASLQRDNLVKGVGRNVRKLISSGITGYAVFNEEIGNETELLLSDDANEVQVEYYTEGPSSFEEEINNGKKITISSDIHYTDILAYAEIRNTEVGKIRIFRTTNGVRERALFDGYDSDDDGLVDYVEWIVPHLSTQTYEIILITKADLLDSNRTYITDIYEYVKEQDDNWTRVNTSQFIRVTFEENLTDKKDITIYARNNESFNTTVEVYYFNSSERILTFPVINYSGYYKEYLTNLNGSHDTFDLKIVNLDNLSSYLEFDHIIDPEAQENLTQFWNKSVDYSSDELLYDVVVDSKDNVYFVGNLGGTDRMHMKGYNGSGVENATWNITHSVALGTGGGQFVWLGADISETDQIYVVGQCDNCDNGGGTGSQLDWTIARYEVNGSRNTTWDIEEDVFNTLGFMACGANQDIAYDVAAYPGGGAVVVGFGMHAQSADCNPQPTNEDWWIRKYDSTGAQDVSGTWGNVSYDGGQGQPDVAFGVDIDSENRTVVVGLLTPTGGSQFGLMQFNSSGGRNWVTTVEQPDAEAYDVVVDSNDDIIAVGYKMNADNAMSQADWFIVKLNSSGNVTWKINFTGNTNQDGAGTGDNDFARGVTVDAENNIYVVGYVHNATGSLDHDWHMKKYNSSGYEEWNLSWHGRDGDDTLQKIAKDSNDFYYLGGYGQNINGTSTSLDWWMKKVEGERIIQGNSAPSAPTIIFPTDELTTHISFINITGSDIDNDKMNFSLYINDTLNITSVVSDYTFNVSQWNASLGYYDLKVSAWDGLASSGNTSIQFTFDPLNPSVKFVNSTPINETYDQSLVFNVSISSRYLNNISFELNGTNFSLYDESLILYFQFDNETDSGENASYSPDISPNNNGFAECTICPGIINRSIGIGAGELGDLYKNSPYIVRNFSGGAYYEFNTSSISTNAGTIIIWATEPTEPDAVLFYVSNETGNFVWNCTKQELTLIAIGKYNEDLYFSHCDGSGDHMTPLGNAEEDEMHMWVAVYNTSSNITTYKNLEVVSDQSYINTTYGGVPKYYYIGSNHFAGAPPMTNQIDSVMVWNRTLSPEELEAVYYSTLQKKNDIDWELYVNNNPDDGNNTYQVHIEDTIGGRNSTELRQITIDTTGPWITNFTKPRFIKIGTTANFTLQASDMTNISYIQASLSPGSVVENMTNIGGLTYNYTNVILTNSTGLNTISVIGYDVWGQESSSANFYYTMYLGVSNFNQYITIDGNRNDWSSMYKFSDSQNKLVIYPVDYYGSSTPIYYYDRNWTSVVAGGYHTCGITSRNDAYCWGFDEEGQAGDGTAGTSDSNTDSPVTGSYNWSKLTAHNKHSCGILSNSSGLCWGLATYGRLGNGINTTGAEYADPEFINITPNEFSFISAGSSHTCGIHVNGTTFCWGYGASGQLGTGKNTTHSSPIGINLTPNNFSFISAGNGFSCGVHVNGTTYCWGEGSLGQLGDGLDTDSNSPVGLSILDNNFSMVTAGADSACAVHVNGTTYCWGSNEDYKLGMAGLSQQKLVPTPVNITPNNFTWVSTKNDHTCGIYHNTSAYCWGNNQSGQLGLGNTTLYSNPRAINFSPNEFSTLEVGYFHSCGTLLNGSAYCWGHDGQGQLATFTWIEELPVQIYAAQQGFSYNATNIENVTIANDMDNLLVLFELEGNVDFDAVKYRVFVYNPLIGPSKYNTTPQSGDMVFNATHMIESYNSSLWFVYNATATGYDDNIFNITTADSNGTDIEIAIPFSYLSGNNSISYNLSFETSSLWEQADVVPDITGFIEYTPAFINVSLNDPANDTSFGPGDPIDFHYTPLSNDLDNCSLWHNMSGTFKLNTTNSGPESGTVNNFLIDTWEGGGIFAWNVQCYDTGGDNAWSNDNFTLEVSGPPTVTQTYPQNGQNIGTNNVNFNYTAFDSDLSNCTLNGNFSGTFKANETNKTITSGIPVIVDLYLEDGYYEYNVICFDVDHQQSPVDNYFFTVAAIQPSEVKFEIQDNSGQTVASVSDNGYMHIKGSLTQGGGPPLYPPDNSFIVQNVASEAVAYIDSSGNLVLASSLFQNDDLDDEGDLLMFTNASNDKVAYIISSGDLMLKKLLIQGYANP